MTRYFLQEIFFVKFLFLSPEDVLCALANFLGLYIIPRAKNYSFRVSNEASSLAEHAESHESALHTPPLQGMGVFHSPYITQTVFSTWVYMIVIFLVGVVFRIALTRPTNFIKSVGVSIVKTLDRFVVGALEDHSFAEKVLFLVGGCFIYIFSANIFGLFIDWIGTFYPAAHAWLRPINSDLNTTIGLALAVLLSTHFIMLTQRGLWGYVGHYLFDFSGSSFIEKCIHVMVGWLHAMGEGIRLISLSMRLFGNIFAGTMLLVIMVYISGQIQFFHLRVGEILTIPFWLLELFVAYVQALVFATLSCVYLKEANAEVHH